MATDSHQLQGFRWIVVVLLAVGCALTWAQTKQEHVHQMGHSVMLFDLSKTMHIFRMTESGGVERVIVKDPTAQDQVVLIQRHLQHEAAAFQHGDYSDPASLHGADMPGLWGSRSRGGANKNFVYGSSQWRRNHFRNNRSSFADCNSPGGSVRSCRSMAPTQRPNDAGFCRTDRQLPTL